MRRPRAGPRQEPAPIVYPVDPGYSHTMSSSQPQSRPRRGRRQIYVHKWQRASAIGHGFVLLVYSLVLFGLAFVVPYVVQAIKLLSSSSIEERAHAGTDLLLLAQNVWPVYIELVQTFWPVLVALILAAGISSFYLTHRVAGPLYRLQVSAKELVEGNLALRIRLRKGDELQDLADLANQATDNIDRAMMEIRSRTASLRRAVLQTLDELKAQPAQDQKVLDRLHGAIGEGEQIEGVLKRFRLSDSTEGPADMR